MRAPPVPYGLTADTGGHIAYVLSAAAAQARRAVVDRVALFTRRFDDPSFGSIHSSPVEIVGPKVHIRRIATDRPRYLEKEALAAELPSFIDGFLSHIECGGDRPDVIHAHFSDAAAVALAARRRYGIRFVYTPHALGLDKAVRCGEGGEPLTARIEAERTALREADAIIVSSRDEAERQIGPYAIEGVERRLRIVAPGAPAPVVAPRVMPPLGFADPAKPLVLAIARPMRKKNLVALAEAFAGSRLCETANLAILAGQHDAPNQGGEEREVLAELRAIIETPALAGRAALPPRHGSADVAALYRKAARTGGVFVNPALHEPFGLTLLEAAAAGLPVVATSQGGAADLVAAVGHGLIVEPRDRAAIARACSLILSDGDLRARLSAAARAGRGLFSWERYARHSCELYQTIGRLDCVAA